MSSESLPQAPEPDVDTPNVARMYDYLLDGSANFAIDRDAVAQVQQVFPGARQWCQANRAFLGRAVRTLARDYGIDQFLDLGSGIPTVGNVHEIAQRAKPDARVAYVDIEPVAVAHARRFLADTDRAVVTRADLREPTAVLAAPEVAGLLDFSRPVAVLALAILDILDIADTPGLVAAYRDACVPGSAMVLSHIAPLAMTEAEWGGNTEVLRSTGHTCHRRNKREVAELMPGYELLNPGVVPSATWRPEQPVPTDAAARSNGYAAVGLLP